MRRSAVSSSLLVEIGCSVHSRRLMANGSDVKHMSQKGVGGGVGVGQSAG